MYFENHKTTCLDPAVLEAMMPFLTESFGLAEPGFHKLAWDAAEALETARESAARLVGARAKEVTFTSSATESNTWAIHGALERRGEGKHVVSQKTEHDSVFLMLEKDTRRGRCEVTFVDVAPHGTKSAGIVSPEEIGAAIRPDTRLVSVQWANPETGAIQPIAEIGRICKERGVLLHVDAAQAAGKVAIDVEAAGVDLLSFCSHKFHGPKGIGCLYIRGRKPLVRLDALFSGGHQEYGRRAGTVDVAAAVGMGKAAELALDCLDSEASRLRRLRDGFHERLTSRIEGTHLVGPAFDSARLPGQLAVSFEGIDAESLVMSIPDLAATPGANTPGPCDLSRVLQALGMESQAIRGTLEMTLGRFTTEAEVEETAAALEETVGRLRTCP